jgi:hypothetical protein
LLEHPRIVSWFMTSGTLTKAAPDFPTLAKPAAIREGMPVTSAPFPKFATHCSTLNANFGNKGALATL